MMKSNRTGAVVATAAALLLMLSGGEAARAQDAAAAPAAAAPPASAAVAIPKSPLAGKKQVQMKGTFSLYNAKTETTRPFFGFTVTVEGPKRFRIDAEPLAGQAKATSFYLADGAKYYEYNALSGEYVIADGPTSGGRQLSLAAGLGLILNPDAPARPGIARTTGEEMLGGRKTVVVTDAERGRQTGDGKTIVPCYRTWYDAQTGLPLRQTEGFLQDGVFHPNLQLDITGWTFDKPAPAGTFVWAVPPGSKAHEEPKLLAAGTAAPDFTAYTPDGKPVKLSDYKGKVVILDFWATWCGPCQKSMPHLESVYEKVKDQNVAVLAVCVWDDKAAYDKWVAQKKGTFTFPTVFDKAGRGAGDVAKSLYKVSGIPTQYVIDKDGRVAASTMGYADGSRFLETALAKMGVTVPAATAAAAAAESKSGG